MLPVPSSQKDVLPFAKELIEQCRVSVGMRSAYYQQLNLIAETGRIDSAKALINLLPNHLTRTADHLFSPVELKFSIAYGRPKPKIEYERSKAIGKELTNTWNRNNTDMTFGRGVYESLKYGACVLKQWPQEEGSAGSEYPVYYDKLVLPWQFGVYREDENRIDRQEALCETSILTGPEVWQRIWHFPDAEKLYTKIMTNARSGTATAEPNSYFHQILSASALQTGNADGGGSAIPGGVVQLNNFPNYMIMGPVVAPQVVQMHELWVKDQDDYVTIQVIEPDILVSPRHKKSNLLGLHRAQPYRLIQPNEVTNWFWGRTELADLIEPQGLLATWCDDTRRLMGLQIDKVLGLIGEAGNVDELAAQMMRSGMLNLPPGSSITDLTPKLPAELIPMLKFCIEIVNTLGGFPEIMQGKGEPGVRAGVHANTLLKTASPSLRDRSLLVERQCEQCADLTLQMMEAKDEEYYWTDGDDPEKIEATKFLISELSPDWRVTVDSHSSSPIFSDENAQLIFQAKKMGTVTDEYVLDNLPFPNKEMAKVQLREKEANQAKQLQQLLQSNPEMGQKLLEKQVGLRGR